MIARTGIDGKALARLAELASSWTGFSAEAILEDRLRGAADELLAGYTNVEELLERAAGCDPVILDGLSRAVSVGETWFFRQPQHFRFVRATLLPDLLRAGRERLRIWSAGCASGEEAWSLAGTVADCAPGVPAEVLGTDLLIRNVEAARRGVYRPWSRRDVGPILHPLFAPGDTFITIDPSLRPLVRFERHNLLDPPPSGLFDLIFCRQVLIYFSPEAAARALAHLISAVAPGGALVFGPLDLEHAPSGLWRIGPPELQIFRRGAPVGFLP